MERIRMTPSEISRSDSEAAHQTALFCWAALMKKQYPELEWLFHIPNGGSRGDSSKSRMIQGAALKAQGVKAGVPDLCLPVKRGQWSGLFIELKKPSMKPVRSGKGGVSAEQKEFGEFVQRQGYGWVVCYSWEEASIVIKQYLDTLCGYHAE